MAVNIRLRNGQQPSGGQGGVTEGDLRGPSTDLIDDGAVVDLAGGHALVHQAGTPAMTVVVDPGVVYIPNASFDYTDSDSIKFWEAVIAGTTISRTLVIDANSSGQIRYDLVCAYLNSATSPDNFADNIASLVIVKGTPGSGIPATPSNERLLAVVKVDNGAVTILDAKITDSRTQVVLKNAVMPLSMQALATGWTPTSDTLVYISPNSFKIAGVDRTNVFQKGTRVKFTNNSITYYGVVIGSNFSTDTTVTLLPNSDFAIDNSAITAPYYSYQASPQGFSGYLNQTSVSVTGFASTTEVRAQYFVIGNKIEVMYWIDGTSNATTFTATLPAAADFTTADSYFSGMLRARDNNAIVPNGGAVSDIESGAPSTAVFYKDYSQTAWTASGSKSLRGTLSYRF